MKIYLAGSLRKAWADRLYEMGMCRRLVSFLDPATAYEAERVHAQASGRVDLFLDSGAFSAWTRGVKIDVEEYAEFVLSHQTSFTVVANLDVIPGAPGQKPTQKDTEKAAAQGWEHYEYLRKRFAGAPFELLHAYHRGEDPKWLKKLMDHSGYFALGGIAMRGLTPDARRVFLDQVMRYVTDDYGWPLCKLHGFGVTDLALMKRYPWASVDSTSWLVGTRYGHVYVPIRGAGVQVAVSVESPKIAEGGEHFRNFTPTGQDVIRRYVEKRGHTIEQLETDYMKRSEFNALFFVDLERRWVDQRWARRDLERRPC